MKVMEIWKPGIKVREIIKVSEIWNARIKLRKKRNKAREIRNMRIK